VQELTARLDEIYRLQKKHHVNSVEELLQVKASIDEKLSTNASLELAIKEVRNELEKQRQQLFNHAKVISASRKKCFGLFENKVIDLLNSLAMPNAQFKVEHILLETLTVNGIDKIRFLFSANKGSELKEIAKVASGGELSRLMLVIKSLIAKNSFIPTIIFDEIDVGVSGSTADQMGRMIVGMADSGRKGGKGMQVIVITHLPQIASKGKSHFTVFKETKGGKTFTQIKNLSEEERVNEIAKMLSTGEPTDASLKNARELLNR
jgi:DNA repair protein RecN (Recombination protein N)